MPGEGVIDAQLYTDLLKEVRGLRQDVGGLRNDLTETQTLVRDYNNLRGKVQAHDKALSNMNAFKDGFSKGQTAVDRQTQQRLDKRKQFWAGVRNWGVSFITLVSVCFSIYIGLHH